MLMCANSSRLQARISSVWVSSGVLLDVVEDEVEGLGVFTVVLDGDGGAASDLSGDALLVELALAEPFAEFGSLFDLEKGDVVGLAERGDELLVLGIIAVTSENAEEGLLAIEGLSNFVESLNEAYWLGS